jgi:hypothetical protein
MHQLLSRGVLVASRSTHFISCPMWQSVDGSVSGCAQLLASHTIADQPRQGVHTPRAPPANIPSSQPQYPSGATTAPTSVPPFAPAVPSGGHAHAHRGPPLFRSALRAWANSGASYGGSPYGAYHPRTTHGLQAQSPFVPLVPQSRTTQAGRDPVQGYAYYSAQHYEDQDPHPDVSFFVGLA